MMQLSQLISRIISQVINPLIVLLFGIALVLFIWGVVSYVIGAQGNETKLAQGKKAIMWGIFGMFIMFSAYGIVRALCDFFGTCVGLR